MSFTLDVHNPSGNVFTKNYTVKVNANATLLAGLQPGKHYTFDLTVGKGKVEISSVGVTDWIDENIDGGIVEYTEPQ